MISAPPRRFERYLRIPFCVTGLDFIGCHCWGLVRLVLMHEAGLSLASYDAISANAVIQIARAMREALSSDEWVKVDCADARAYDVVLMSHSIIISDGRPSRPAMHCGIMLTRKHVLHVEHGRDSVCVPINQLRNRVLGIYRHRSLAQ